MTEYLQHGDAQLPVRISYRVLKKLESGKKDDVGQYDLTERLLYLSLEEGHRKEGVKFTVTLSQLEDMIDDSPEILAEFNEISKRQMGELVKKMTGAPLMTNGASLNETA